MFFGVCGLLFIEGNYQADTRKAICYVMRHKGGAWRGEMTIQLGSTSYFVCSESWMQECHHCLFNASVKEFILAHLKKESQQQTPKKILYKSSIS